MMNLALLARSAIAIDLQIFAPTTGTTVLGNPGAPKRAGTRDPLSWPIDLTVTPTAGVSANQPGGIQPNEFVFKTAANGLAGLTTTGAANANAGSCVGVSAGQYPPLYSDGIFAPEPSSSPQGSVPYMDVYEEGDFLFNTTAAESYSPMTTVYLGADGRTISTVATGVKVGYISPDQRPRGGVGLGGFAVAPPTFPITGGAGVVVYVRITPALTNPNG